MKVCLPLVPGKMSDPGHIIITTNTANLIQSCLSLAVLKQVASRKSFPNVPIASLFPLDIPCYKSLDTLTVHTAGAEIAVPFSKPTFPVLGGEGRCQRLPALT